MSVSGWSHCCIKSIGRTAEIYIDNVEILFHTRKNLLELTEIKAMLSRADGFLTQHRHLNENEGTHLIDYEIEKQTF